MPWFRRSVDTDNTIISYFLCLINKLKFCYTIIAVIFQMANPNLYVNSKKVGGGLTPPPQYFPLATALHVTMSFRIWTVPVQNIKKLFHMWD
jgi:hypothetical protein